MNQSVVDHTQITYRVGRKDDCLRIAELDNIASGGAIEYLFRDLIPGMTPVEIIALNLEQDSYPHTFRNVILAEYKAQILGMALSFPAKYHTITRQMRRFFPAERLRHFKQFFSTRVEGSYYLDALCVDANYRKIGIGDKLIDLTKTKAGHEGFDTLSLIAFADNTIALHLYEQKGFSMVDRIELKPHRLIPHQGGCVLMKCGLEALQS